MVAGTQLAAKHKKGYEWLLNCSLLSSGSENQFQESFLLFWEDMFSEVHVNTFPPLSDADSYWILYKMLAASGTFLSTC
jgi:hypothetical protein